MTEPRSRNKRIFYADLGQPAVAIHFERLRLGELRRIVNRAGPEWEFRVNRVLRPDTYWLRTESVVVSVPTNVVA